MLWIPTRKQSGRIELAWENIAQAISPDLPSTVSPSSSLINTNLDAEAVCFSWTTRCSSLSRPFTNSRPFQSMPDVSSPAQAARLLKAASHTSRPALLDLSRLASSPFCCPENSVPYCYFFPHAFLAMASTFFVFRYEFVGCLVKCVG
jgi:hypothetical protein